MASTSSLKSVIKSEKFPCHRIPNQSIPPVIVINDGSQHSSAGNNDSNSESANGGHAASSPAASSQPVAATRAPPETMTNRPRYGRVVISLENPILPEETIKNTPSQIDGLDCETENDLRITGCKLIQISGVLLRLPQVAMATGQVLFQRYYYSKSFVRFPMEITAMACVVLASKVEEAPRRIRDIINVFHNMKQIRLNQPPVPMFLNEAYVTLKNNVIKAERRILKELGFCVHVKHPHKYIITVAEILGNSKNAELIQAAWSYMNDSLQSNVFVRFSPETIACACIHLSARILREPLPTRPPWHLVFGVDTETINQVCTTILQLYTRTPLSQEELEEKVDCARRVVDDAKVKARAQLVAQNAENPSSVSTGLLDSLVDSRTNSPIKYSDHGGAGGGGGGGISSKLEVISALNRVKQHQASGLASKSSSPLVKSTIAATSTATTINVNSAQNSAANTPIKLEKSPRTLAAPSSSSSRSKRSRSPTPGDSRHSSTRRSRRSRSRSSPDDDRRSGHHQADNSREGDRYRNGHQNTGDYYAEGDSRPRQYRDANIDNNRSPTPPRSYITSRVTTVSNHNSSNSDYYSRSSAKSSSGSSYRDSRYDDNSSSSRYPSSSSSSNRYDYRGGSGQRGSDRHRDYEYEDSRRGGDRDRDRDRSDYRDHQDDYRPRSRDYRDEGGRGGGGGYEESGGARSRSRSPYQYRSSSSRDYHKSSSSSSSGRNKSRY